MFVRDLHAPVHGGETTGMCCAGRDWRMTAEVCTSAPRVTDLLYQRKIREIAVHVQVCPLGVTELYVVNLLTHM